MLNARFEPVMEELSPQDIEEIGKRQLSIDNIFNQLRQFKKGFPPAHLHAAATTESGILKLSKEEIAYYVQKYDHSEEEVIKFVPASGAASRMFKTLYAFLEDFDGTSNSLERLSREDKKIGRFFGDIDQFAFFDDLNQRLESGLNLSIHEAKSQLKHGEIIKTLLEEKGLNYGSLPKGLLKFHTYETEERTAAQEQLYEGLAYATKNGKLNLHFTVSPEHKESFESHINKTIEALDVDIEIIVTYSTQKSSTDTVASTVEFTPFRDDSNQILFRPAGHGALLQNLDELDSGIIFIKNIDNVVPDRLKSETIEYKKVIAGVLLEYQNRSFELLSRYETGENIAEEARELLEEMGVKDFDEKEIKPLLDRPIRVCGMVKNEGEPGGGPFWVRANDMLSLQIVESAQVDKEDTNQKKIFKRGTHFNPVDIVCGVRNYRGEKFDLLKYRDDNSGFITEKSYNGQKLLAMELPGLWNGSMAYWNTIFVEVPLITFNPVKTVTDLLKPAHR